jgi:hypothetical protein
MPLPSS